MKYIGFIAICVLLLTMLVSCYWLGNYGTGSLSMDFSQIQARQPGDVVRVYLLANGLLFSTDPGVPFTAEVPLGTDEDTVIKIDGLPVGPRYKALVGAGPTSQGIFSVYYYGESEDFQVSSGDDITVTTSLDYLSLPPNSSGIFFSTDLLGKNLVGVAASSSDVYTAEASKLYLVYLWDSTGFGDYEVYLADSYDLAADPNGDGVSSHRVNGLSQGNYWSALMNSNKGIVPLYGSDGWGFDLPFSSMLNGNKEIEESDLLYPGSDQAVFFRRENGIGGTFISSDVISSPDQWKWVNLELSGVRDMVLGENVAYFATDDGAFALPISFLNDPSPSISEYRMNFSAPAEILSLGCIPIVGAPDKLFIGTTNGVWETDVLNESPLTLGSLTQIPETAGETIEIIDISEYWTNANQAFLSRYYLYIRYYGAVYKIPFFAVLPGKVTGITWTDFSELYISGTEGLSVLDVGS